LAVPADSPVTSVADLAATATGTGGALRVSTEYPELTSRFLESHGVRAEVSLSYGATEAKVPDIADCVVEITETGRALRAAGLKIVETLLVSHTEFIANPTSAADPDKRHAMQQLLTLLQGSLEARGKVLVKLNVAAEQLDGVIELLPALRSPTVSELFGGGGFAVETVVPKSEINVLIPALRDRGATDIIELALSKIVH
jgi:ATP phosphoribosyltransferase